MAALLAPSRTRVLAALAYRCIAALPEALEELSVTGGVLLAPEEELTLAAPLSLTVYAVEATQVAQLPVEDISWTASMVQEWVAATLDAATGGLPSGVAANMLLAALESWEAVCLRTEGSRCTTHHECSSCVWRHGACPRCGQPASTHSHRRCGE